MPKSVAVLLGFIFISLALVIIAFKQETNRLAHIIENNKVIVDSLKEEIEIEKFDKGRYINIVEQVSELDCKEVKEIMHGTE